MTDTMHPTNKAMDSAKGGTLLKIANALPMIAKGLGAASAIVSIMKKLDSDGGLAWIGFPRRKSPLLTVAVLGAGAVIGAGIALWLSPQAAANLKNAIAGHAKDTAMKTEIKTGDAKHTGGSLDGAAQSGA